MNGWSIVAGLLAVLWFFDALRLRQRLASLVILKRTGGDVGKKAPNSEHVFITRNGRFLDPEIRQAASAMLEARRLEVLILMPDDLPTAEALVCLQTIDLKRYRNARIARSYVIGEAFLVHKDVLTRMGSTPSDPQSADEFARLADQFKKYSSISTEIAMAEGLKSSRSSYGLKGSLLHLFYGELGSSLTLLQLVLLVAALGFSPKVGLVALAIYCLQPFLIFKGSAMKSQELTIFSLLRPFFEVRTSIESILYRQKHNSRAAVDRERGVYQELLSEGTARFFEKARSDCPICGHRELKTMVATGDFIQFKPGTFVISRCKSCDHKFQNPRLSLEGLSFYYRDFYDGLGEEKVEGVFGHASDLYHARANMLVGTATPTRWLDVGGGHGHFCSLARDIWPDVSFDVLDLSSNVEMASKRGWADRSYRGLFPDLAENLAEKSEYDVISMSHYLEHTRDPQSEIEAAAKVLPPGGHLMIELPDPDCRFGKIFGSYWLPWFQPQHQHFLSVANLDRILKANAFEPIKWHRGEAQRPVDIMVSVGLMMNRLARPVDVPWIPETTYLARLWHKLVFMVGLPLLLVSRMLDLLLAPLLRRPGWSNNYRVLARRVA